MTLWKEKIFAFSHGPLGKTWDLGAIYRQRVESYLNRIFGGARGAPYEQDPAAAAYDSLFPNEEQDPIATKPEILKLEPGFVHPFTGQKVSLPISDPATAGDLISRALPAFPQTDEASQFWLLWRAWLPLGIARAADGKSEAEALAAIPANIRFPNRTLWSHRSIMSALEATRRKDGKLRPAFLLFHAGPLHDFIATARNPQDLWSGSFLISWMMAHAIKTLTDQLGPDCVIFPFLRGQLLFDWLHRDLLQGAVFVSEGREATSAWKELGLAQDAAQRLALIPSLPNRFLAVVPEGFAVDRIVDEFNSAVEKSAWHRICEGCWTSLLESGVALGAERRRLWDHQVRHFWRLSWQLWPWSEQAGADQIADAGLRESNAASTGANQAAQSRPANQRHTRSEPLTRAWAWSTHYQLVSHRLAARRQTREFAAWPANPVLTKDSVSGKSDALVDSARQTEAARGNGLASLVGKNGQLRALNLIRRTWPQAILGPQGLLPEGAGIGSLLAFPSEQKGYAVLMLDADDIARWLAGDRSPKVSAMISASAVRSLLEHIDRAELDKWLDSPAAFLPSVHLQFSEALANFSLHCARRIVEAHHGQLLFAGGDSVLVTLPAAEAIACADGLRLAFQGSASLPARYERLFAPTHPGFVKLSDGKVEEGGRLQSEPAWPLLVPGERATVSIGIAIGGCRDPLPEMVQQARAAIRRAKARTGKDALAITACGRSDSMISCVVKFGSAAFDLLTLLSPDYGCSRGSSNAAQTITRLPQRVMQRLMRLGIDAPLRPELAELVLAELKCLFEECYGKRERASEEERSTQLRTELLSKARDSLNEFQALDDPQSPRTEAVRNNAHVIVLREFYNLFALADSINRVGG